ncbi:aldehyde dehydrogenase family protein [Kutzneria sp. NPDC052558]|uniref:aldehyde dehydrogenase family protein n=1 Tax=Kutzneria sp. NPDC052558 TaxID=3364121 RepID=UPI0037CAA804
MTFIARHWIDGQWRESDRVAESTDPATGEVVGRYADGGRAEAEQSVRAARRAFEQTEWSRDRALRHKVLSAMADAFGARAGELALTLTTENGKTLVESGMEVASAGPAFRHTAAQALTETGIAAEVANGVYFSTLTEPAGVAALIIPWNAPVALFVRALAPALAAGNTVVAKLPGQTALTNALMAEIISEVQDLPRGVVNIFTESGNTGAPFLVESPDVDVVSFTGSVAVGKAVAAAGAATLKRINLELGGKTPLIVFDDADVAAAIPVLAASMTAFAGQFCMAGTRFLVHRAVADAVRDGLRDALESIVVGPGRLATTQMGPLIDKAAVRRVDEAVERSLAYAKPIVRGGPITTAPFAAGAFYRPSLLAVEDVNSPLVQEELFAPVATFEVFDDEDDAVRRANATEFGLAAAVFTRDVDRARRVGRALRAGTVWTNTWFVLDDGFAEGGFKSSGIGRLRGPLATAAFGEAKTYVQISR